jgi:DNA-binding Lrp family transcriptional regulator
MNVEPNMERAVLDKVKHLRNVIEAHMVYGPYDIFLKAEARTVEELNQLIVDDIRSIEGIKTTMTCFLAS